MVLLTSFFNNLSKPNQYFNTSLRLISNTPNTNEVLNSWHSALNFNTFDCFYYCLQQAVVTRSLPILFNSPTSYIDSSLVYKHFEKMNNKKLYPKIIRNISKGRQRFEMEGGFNFSYHNLRFFRYNLVFNSYTPNYTHSAKKIKIIKDLRYKQLLNVQIRTKKTQRYLNSLLANFNYNQPVSLISNNYISGYKYLSIWRWATRLLRQYPFLKKTRVCAMLVSSLLSSIRFKDIKPLTSVLKDIFEHVHYSKHRQYFYLTSFIIKNICFSKKRLFGVKGMKVYFGGKLGVGGNAKKRRKHIKFGKCSNTSKNLRIEYASDCVRTSTGVFGFSVAIYY